MGKARLTAHKYVGCRVIVIFPRWDRGFRAMHRELDQGERAFSSFRALKDGDNRSERQHLFRNMAQLFSYVSDRCDDEQVAQYDEVLCQLAELVEVEARAHVAKLLAP